jgi:hypothetical protein
MPVYVRFKTSVIRCPIASFSFKWGGKSVVKIFALRKSLIGHSLASSTPVSSALPSEYNILAE